MIVLNGNAYREVKLTDLEKMGLSDDAIHKTSFFDFADEILTVIKSMELKPIRQQWVIGTYETLYGCIQISTSHTDKEVQQINEIGIPNSTLQLYTRYSASSQKYAPSFVGAAFVNLLEDPYLISTGIVGDKVHQSQGRPFQDIVEAGVAGVHSGGVAFKNSIDMLKKKKMKLHEAYGLCVEAFDKGKLAFTKMTPMFATLKELAEEKKGVVNGVDVLRAFHTGYEGLSVPQQYEFLCHSTPTLLEKFK
jgi:hypothetical protein